MDDLDLGATIRGFSPGQKAFNRYTLSKILGRGGMGVVWLARDEELEREVALKFLPEVIAMDKQAILELKRETRRSLELTHPHIIRIYDFVQDGRTAAISMEFVSGDTLAALKVDQPEQRFAPGQLEKWIRQLCEAIEYAHGKAQVVHRDLKPANLMIDARGDLKIADFGIAASVSDSVSRVSNQAGSSGTPVYMSPQQMMGEKPAISDDLYSLGATLYDLITGKPPFHSGNIIAQVQSKVPPAMSARLKENGAEVAVPAAWDEAVSACLAKEVDMRPKTARELGQRLGLFSSATAAPFAAPPGAAAPAKTPAALRAKPETPAGKKSLGPLLAVLFGAVLLIGGGLGWYFGLHLPAQEKARLAQEQQLQEQVRLAEEKELAVAIKEVETHFAAAEWTKAEIALAAMERTAAGKPAGWAGQWASAVSGLQSALKQSREEARLAALRIPVTVRTNPVGAEIVLDGTPRGLSPLAGLPLPLGRHSIVARLANHDESEQTIEVTEKGQSDWTLPLVRSTGKLTFQVRPTGAEYALHSVDDNGRRLSSAQRITGVIGSEPLVIQTGSYEVLVSPKGKVAGLEHRETVVIRRGETATIAADVRPGSLSVTSTPSGAEVWRAGRKIGVTPLTIGDLAPKQDVELELRLAGFKSAKEIVHIPNADTPQEWSAELVKNTLQLKADFSGWRKRVAIDTNLTQVVNSQTEVGGQVTRADPQRQNISVSSEYDLSTGAGGQFNLALSRQKRFAGADNPIAPGTVIAFQKLGRTWQTSFASGGFTNAANKAGMLSPTYAALWLDETTMPPGPAEAGSSWVVPVAAADTLLPSLRLLNPRGTIRGRVVAADPSAASPWVQLEYTFDVTGEFDPALFPPSPGFSVALNARYAGTLSLRLDLGAGLVSEAVVKHRGDLRAEVRASGPAAAPASRAQGVALMARAKVEAQSAPTAITITEQETSLTITARPLEGESQAGGEIVAAAPREQPKVPVYFNRKNNALVGIAARLGVDLNREQLVRLSDGTYQKVELAPGTYPIQVVQSVGNSKGIRVDTTIEVVAGRTNYFEIGFGMTRPNIRVQSESEGAGMVARLKPSAIMTR